MIQCITDDSVFLSKNSLKETSISIEAAGIQDCVLSAMKLRDGLFELLVEILMTALIGRGGILYLSTTDESDTA
jgi:hypothetical protein